MNNEVIVASWPDHRASAQPRVWRWRSRTRLDEPARGAVLPGDGHKASAGFSRTPRSFSPPGDQRSR